MCGINLCFGEANVKHMNFLLGHRGIRSKYQELTNNLFLGHVRLPIQGLSKEDDHPLSTDVLTGAFVGEIFNYKEMSPSSRTDLPVILTALKTMGRDCFTMFDGFWSVIAFDRTSNLIHIFTDHLAKKPLYIRRRPFAISSEIKALTCLGENTFDETYFSAVAKWGYCPENKTPFNEIDKIPAGVHIVIGSDGRLHAAETFLPIQPKKSSLYNVLDTAVKNRTVSDVPISLLMSGGLDSTIIYYLLRKYKKELTIFHIDNDESQYLDYIDFRPTDKLVKINIDGDYNLESVLNSNDGPVDLGSMIPQYLLAKEIRKHGFDVCLSGDGADELFGGYKRITSYDSQYSDIYHELIYYHLPRLDKMMMAHTVELRCPFLSVPVIANALSLPYKDRINKASLKAEFRGIVPDEIIDRVKQPLRHRTERLSRNNLIDLYRSQMKRINIV